MPRQVLIVVSGYYSVRANIDLAAAEEAEEAVYLTCPEDQFPWLSKRAFPASLSVCIVKNSFLHMFLDILVVV